MSKCTPLGLLILSSSDVDKITSTFTPNELMGLMAKAFTLSNEPRSDGSSSHSAAPSVYVPHRTSIPSKNHTVLFMPARIVSSHLSASKGAEADRGFSISRGVGLLSGTTIKVVSVPLSTDAALSTGPNAKSNMGPRVRGLPATVLVLDEETGSIRAVVNARSLTALRTAAGSLLSTTLVGPINPVSVVAFGAGKQVQAHIHLHLLHFPSIQTCTIVTRSSLSPNINDVKTDLEPRFGSVQFNFLVSSSLSSDEGEEETKVKEAVWNASVIICATSSTRPLFPSSWVRAGTHVILVGSFKPEMKEVDTKLVLRAVQSRTSKSKSGDKRFDKRAKGMILVDSRSACKLEAGELIEASIGDEDMTEIGELVSRADPEMHDGESRRIDIPVNLTREDTEDGEDQITIFKSVGLGVQDVAIACMVVKRAEEMGIGMYIGDYDIYSKI
ncbi:hypothetical protein AX15_005351 [Amanita polypyramis BW_CC]|nr:hypothetical protein AX15_005351 [Amanita polypyramis BW_CC]